jgi:hypothetical protein
MLEKLPIFVLQSAGHSGIDWTHSLLDSHTQVLIMPAFSFYRTIYEIEIRNSIDLKKKNLSQISEIFSDIFLNNKIYKVKRRQFIHNKSEKEIFKKKLYEYLSRNNLNIYKRIFFGLHYAYSKLYKIDINKIKCIVIHEHVTWHFDKYENIFNAKHILVFRNPKAAIAGSFYKLRQLNQIGNVNSFQFDHIILDMLVTFKILKMNKNNFFILQNELMHSDFKGQLNNLCNWLDINFENCLLSQTFLGKEWKGESSYLAWDEVEEKPDEEYYLEKNVEFRWRKVLSKKDILIIETIFYDFMIKLNYKFDNKMNILKKIKGYYLYFTLYLNQDMYAYSKIIIKIRNIIRKLLILIFKQKVASIFKFK